VRGHVQHVRQETITTIEDCAVDLFGGDGRPSLEAFLRDAEYARVQWWPQRGAERVLVWQRRQIPHARSDRHGASDSAPPPRG
jgi:D-arabinono-1,4-lactone oxidase